MPQLEQRRLASGSGKRISIHGVMKKVSRIVSDVGKMPYAGQDPALVQKLRAFARLFVQLQEQRHEADYNMKEAWTFTQSVEEVLAASQALAIWQEIRTANISQDFLVSLLIRPRD